MKNERGFGQISKLSGKRRNPYAAYPPSTKRYPNGHYIREKAIGYYHTRREAFEALLSWHKNPKIIENLTAKDIYEKWLTEKKKDNLSQQTITTYEGFQRYFTPIFNIKYSELRISDFQDLLDNSDLSWSSQNTLRSMIKQIGVYALKNDYVQKNYAQFVKVRKENDQIKGIPFTKDEIDLFWSIVGTQKGVEEVLILIYTGLRITELKKANIDLEKDILISGVKTEAGKNRIVPIHPKIKPLIEKFEQKHFQPEHWRNRKFNPLMDELGIRYVGDVPHTPHDCRHTFSWLADKYKIDKLSKHLLMGHSPKGVEDAVYGHRTVEELRAEIEKIKM